MTEVLPRLWRSREHKVIAGVLGGLAERFGVDPSTMRVLYVVLSALSAAFPGALVYVILWAVTSYRDDAPRDGDWGD